MEYLRLFVVLSVLMETIVSAQNCDFTVKCNWTIAEGFRNYKPETLNLEDCGTNCNALKQSQGRFSVVNKNNIYNVISHYINTDGQVTIIIAVMIIIITDVFIIVIVVVSVFLCIHFGLNLTFCLSCICITSRIISHNGCFRRIKLFLNNYFFQKPS